MTGNESVWGPWRKSRYGFAAFWLLSLLGAWLVLRAVLLVAFKPAAMRMGEVAEAFIAGLQRDLFAALLLTLPLGLWLLITPNARFKAAWHRYTFWTVSGMFWLVQIFLLFVEFFFFDEFKSRFNTVAVDYLIYPHEVFVNIWESYHVGLVLAVCVLFTVGWLATAARLFGRMWDTPFPRKARAWRFLVLLGATALLAPTIEFKGAHVSADRTLNEIANNGPLSFLTAAWTRHLDYSAFYLTIPREEAYNRVRRMLAAPGAAWEQERCDIRRRVPGDANGVRLNVVLFLEESLGSEFWGCLGRSQTLTPEMDKLAAQEGLLFTNLYASGNRTVRGMEGVLSSFPPLPGDSIVKRDLSDNVETLARVLKRDGYSTVFLYGGRGLFDGMRSFAVRNGYDAFIEQKHFQHPRFTTIWGVCDEDLFDRAVDEFHALSESGKPFFGTILSVSNHKPYTYPKGTIPEDPEQRRRENAVKYSDYALGRFFARARQERFWSNTVFVVVADHGARVYGEQSIPIGSYEIPMVIAGPAVVSRASKCGTLGCSLDVAPTILGLIGRPYESTFFGRDLLKEAQGGGRVLLNHNRDIGMLAGSRLAVLGLMQTQELYEGNPKQVQMKPRSELSDSDRDLIRDTTAIYQVADELYVSQSYRVEKHGLNAGRQGTGVMH